MGSSKEASMPPSLREGGAPLSSPKGGGRRGAGKQVVPLVDQPVSKSLNYRLEREALFAASESLNGMDFLHDRVLPLKMPTNPGISSLSIPSIATDAVAVNCFKGLRRSRKGARSPIGELTSEQEELDGDKSVSLRSRRMKKLEYKADSDDDYHFIEPEEGKPKAKGSRRGKVVDMETQTIGASFEQEQPGNKNPCNTPNGSPAAESTQLAQKVTNAFLHEPVRIDKATTRPRIEQQLTEMQTSMRGGAVVEGFEPSVKGSRRPRLANDTQRPNNAEVQEALPVPRNLRRLRAEQALLIQGNQSIASAEARPSVRTSLKAEQPESVSGNVLEAGPAMRASGSTRAKHSQHKRKAMSHKENLSTELHEPPARMPKLESQSPMLWQCLSESTYPDESHWVNAIVEVLMWRDVPRSSLLFGMGCFFILSASFMQEMRCGVITIGAYSALLHLSAVFIYKNFIRRELPLQAHGSQITEADVLDFIRFLLPSINFVSRKVSQMFSGDPTSTLRLTVSLWLLAQTGYWMSVLTLARVAFFAMFIVPRCYSGYSTQLQRQVRSTFFRLFRAWSSCSHKKLVLVGSFLLAWNLSSFPARLCGAFLLLVFFRLYQQTHDLFQHGADANQMEVDNNAAE